MPSVDELWAWLQTPVQELVTYKADNPEKTWEEHRAYFVERLGLSDPSDHPLVEELVRYLEDRPDERETLLEDVSRIEPVVLEIAQRHAEEDAGETPADDSYDETAWQAFLVENGARWIGDDETWAAFREWFVYYAADAGFGQPANALMEYLDSQSAPERIATFAQYGVVIAVAEEEPAAAVEAGPLELADEDIQALIDENPEFADISEDRRKELIAQLLAGE
jgi:hypothetical protein